MDAAFYIEITNKALLSTAIVAIPILIPALVTGVLISLFQAVTQISEQTLTFTPKLFMLIVSYLAAGPWIIRYISNFSIGVISRIGDIGFQPENL